ncbi:hypothetical protein [Microbacterium sp. NPDC089695]|uniref:hypothetical protein n=1 Tax=Microbacterium sp. NPDC089695 TaxID=3364198 RepID=UPI00380ABB43
MQKNTRKRSLIAGGIAAVLVAGVTAGGALVTRDSTIFNNVFGAVAAPANPAEMTVAGPSMTYDFTGAQSGESKFEYYTVANKSATNKLKFNVSALPQSQNANVLKLMANLDTRIVVNGTTIETGKLDKMNIPTAQLPELAANKDVTVRVEVYIKDAAAFKAANIPVGTQLTVDFLYNSIFS